VQPDSGDQSDPAHSQYSRYCSLLQKLPTQRFLITSSALITGSARPPKVH
jgi:hypothetical protein